MNETRKKFLFYQDYGTGTGVWMYFFANSERDVRRKYPTLRHFEDAPSWMTEEYRAKLLARAFDVDDDPASHRILRMLASMAEEYFSSLGDQVLPPK